MEESKIIDLFLSRDEAALIETEKKYGNSLRALANGMLGDSGAAEECLNDLYMKLWSSIPPNQPRNHFYAYSIKIIRNIALDYIRNGSRLKRSTLICELSDEMSEAIADIDDVNTALDEKLLIERLNLFLSDLPEERRNIFIRRYWFCDSIREIEKRFGISESKAKTTLLRTRKELKEALK